MGRWSTRRRRGLVLLVLAPVAACSGAVARQAPTASDPGTSEAGTDAAETEPDSGITGPLDASREAATPATTTSGQSCASGSGPGVSTCGPDQDSCCTSLGVPGGTFFRDYDGVTFGHESQAFPATVSGLRVDKYLVTVGRFRQWVSQFSGGQKPPLPAVSGLGIHTHLHGGQGLVDTGGTFEPGYVLAWNSLVPAAASEWNLSLCSAASADASAPAYPGYCSDGDATWTPAPAGNEALPVNFVTWYEAYAFCIWDAENTEPGASGFLPSDAELDYVMAGGDEQRFYPWSSPPMAVPSPFTCAYATYGACMGDAGIFPESVGSAAMGGGKWGQLDLTGNLSSWTLDYYAPSGMPPTPCVDCGNITGLNVGVRISRGGNFASAQADLVVAEPHDAPPSPPSNHTGFRCARTP